MYLSSNKKVRFLSWQKFTSQCPKVIRVETVHVAFQSFCE